MDQRLIYHTSINSKVSTPLALPFSKVDYHTSLCSTSIALENLKKVNNRLDDTNIITLAYLANNPYLNDEDREKYSNKLKEIAMKELHLYERCIENLKATKQDETLL